jgi:hypothetical protein
MPTLNFYMDDSGTRKPDRAPTAFDPKRPNHFALGGILILEDDEGQARAAHVALCERWCITYPLHSVDMRSAAKEFRWLRRVPGIPTLYGGSDTDAPWHPCTRTGLRSSPMAQIADLYLWPILRERYRPGYRPYQEFRTAGRLIECVLAEADVMTCGSKYSCFELVDATARRASGGAPSGPLEGATAGLSTAAEAMPAVAGAAP